MCWIGNEKQLRRVLFSECEFLMDIVSGVWQWTTMMVKLNYNYSHCSTTATRIKNVASLFASSTLQRWTILLLLLYKLDYKDYYCYGSSSSSSNSAIFNNENGKKIFSLDLFFSRYKMLPLSGLPSYSQYTSIESQYIIQTTFCHPKGIAFLSKREWRVLIIFIHSLNIALS